MKTKLCNLIVLFLLFNIISCKPEYIKINEKLINTWQLDSFSYKNEQGSNISLNSNKYSIKFEKNKIGKIFTDSLSFDFIYDFGYEQFEGGFADCDIKVEKNRTLPINVIGRIQVYSYKFIDSNTILFYSENEFDYLTNKIIKNATYKFVKI